MQASEELAGLLDTDEAVVERIVEHFGQPVAVVGVAIRPAKAKPVKFRAQTVAGCNGPKHIAQTPAAPAARFSDLAFWAWAAPLLTIAERCRHRVVALLEASIDAFFAFLPEISDVVRRNHGLNVGR